MKIWQRCEWISKIPLRCWWAWKKWFLNVTTFLAPTIFWNMRSEKRSKNSWSQKSCHNQKSVFSCPSTVQRNFWNPFTPVIYFYNFFPELLIAASIPWIKNFNWKSVCEVFFNMQNWNFRVAPESETIGFVLFLSCYFLQHGIFLLPAERKITLSHASISGLDVSQFLSSIMQSVEMAHYTAVSNAESNINEDQMMYI